MNATHIRDFIVSDCVTTLIRVQAGRLCRRLGFRYADRNDIQQEMFLHLLRRIDRFDPQRGSLIAFVRHLIKHSASHILRSRRSLKRGGEFHVQSIDGIVLDVDGEAVSASEMVAESDIQRRIGTTATSNIEQFEQNDAIEHVYCALSMAERDVWSLLTRRTPAAVAREMATSRRRIRNVMAVIRSQLESAGLKYF